MDIKLNEIPRASQTQQSGHRRPTSERKEPKGIESIHLNEEKRVFQIKWVISIYIVCTSIYIL